MFDPNVNSLLNWALDMYKHQDHYNAKYQHMPGSLNCCAVLCLNSRDRDRVKLYIADYYNKINLSHDVSTRELFDSGKATIRFITNENQLIGLNIGCLFYSQAFLNVWPYGNYDVNSIKAQVELIQKAEHRVRLRFGKILNNYDFSKIDPYYIYDREREMEAERKRMDQEGGLGEVHLTLEVEEFKPKYPDARIFFARKGRLRKWQGFKTLTVDDLLDWEMKHPGWQKHTIMKDGEFTIPNVPITTWTKE